jgi:hypothetical protein
MIADTVEEKDFKERYAQELTKKVIQNSVNPHFGLDEISDERARVKASRNDDSWMPGRANKTRRDRQVIP